MRLSKNPSIFHVLFIILSFALADAARFEVTNKCASIIWAGAVPGGGRKLNQGDKWAFDVSPGTKGARIWPRTGCSFDASGHGRCQTGDCGGLLQCTGYGTPPNTLAEYGLKQYNDQDFIDISLVDGFNVPMEFGSTSGGCTSNIRCTADINRQCPSELRTAGGCNNPCTVFKSDRFCCNSGNCGPTEFSKFFKDRCPDVYSYPQDDRTSKCVFACPSGTNYKVVFCP